MDTEGSAENKVNEEKKEEDAVNMVIEPSEMSDCSNNQDIKSAMTEKNEKVEDKTETLEESKKMEVNEKPEDICQDTNKVEELKCHIDEKINSLTEEEKDSKIVDLKEEDGNSVKQSEIEEEADNGNTINMQESERNFEGEKEVEKDFEMKEIEDNYEKKVTFVSDDKLDSEVDIEEKDSEKLVVNERAENDLDNKEKGNLANLQEEKDNAGGNSINEKEAKEDLTMKEGDEAEIDSKDEIEQSPQDGNKVNEITSSKFNENEKVSETMDIQDDNVKEKVEESKEEKEKDSIKKGKDTITINDSERKHDSDISENSETKDSEEKPPEEVPEGLQMEVDDEDNHSDELPDQINFVDVNAPPPCESPLLIDDDDDDDDIICMVDKGKTGTKPRMRNRRKIGIGRISSSEGLKEDVNKKGQEIIIDLDDDDDIEIETIRTRKKRNRTGRLKGVSCCNITCPNQDEDLRRAPVFVLTYYGCKYKKGRADKVCSHCFDVALQHQEHLAYLLTHHEPLLSADFHHRNDTVVLTDSDEEDVCEDVYIPEDVLEDIQNQIDDVLTETMEKYDLDFQIRESEDILTKRFDKLCGEFEETDTLLNEFQKKVDQLRYDIYKDYIPTIQEVPSLTIDDSHCGIKEPIILVSPPSSANQISNVQQQFIRQQQPGFQNLMSNVTAQQRQRFISSPSQPSTSQDIFRKSPLGVATKKVTQIQRSLGSNQQEMRQEDVVALEQVEVTHKPLPPIGPITRPKPHVGDVMYVMKLSFYGVWSRAKVLEIVPKGSELSSGSLSIYTMYKVKFESSYRKSNPLKQVTGKQMAYTSPSPVRFPVGTRVIAIFQDIDWSKECYYSGVIAEPPKSMNNYRYLVFFDDGYAQYVTHEKILLVCESSRHVWEDIHPDSREFIRKYLDQYPERPMVKLQQGQIVKTEWNGKWWIARVVEVDGSLVKMHFDADGRSEWIYRGSTRLGPLYAELAHAAARKEQGTFSRHRGLGVATLKKRNMPYVEYTRGTEGEEVRRDDSGESHVPESTPSRAVARKSTTKRPESLDNDNQEEIIHSTLEKKPHGKVNYLQLNTSKRPKTFEPHQCGSHCLIDAEYDPKAMKGMNPLLIPLLCTWERQITRCRGKRSVIYRAPCGRRLRNMEELHRYLRITRSNMAVDLFDFDFWVHCFAEFILEKGFSNIKDMSYGAEYVQVPCVNCIDHKLPDFVLYSTKREATEGVNLNLDTEFLTGCDCTDDCQDRDKCACWQLTIQGTAYGPGGVVDPTVGYIYRRLPEPVMTGIYECNSRCKCSNTCLNRVAQQPLQIKLQVFKTEKKGWGIRCLNDIPQGGFICIYAGRLLTEQGANEGGKNYGDEYLAELDYIEVVEKLKEGYESDVVEDDSESLEEEKGSSETRRTKAAQPVSESSQSEEEEEEADNSQDNRDSDEEFQLTAWTKQTSISTSDPNSIRSRLRNRSSRHGSEDSQADGKDKEKDKDDRDSDKASSDDRNSRKGDGHKKNPRSVSSSDHNYSDDEDSELLRQPSRFAAMSIPKESDKIRKPKCISVREFFGKDEYCYIMDAKTNGNIGRYLNHSCSPNVFVQNVFVDTHDLRFPWVAFFALTYIQAGTELTWDYNYDVGSVPGKVLHCYCESNDCRGRLL